ncbi:MAG: GH32 C-terminal domain-containing protein [Bacteroidales bacterium]|nr:GH32 C-terminal domain-containing protein [Bacteroidales bacterium]
MVKINCINIMKMLKKTVLFLFVATLVSCVKQTEELHNYWKFDESKGIITYDQISGVNDSINYIFLVQDPISDPIRRKGIVGKALMFDGFSTYIEREAVNFISPQGSFSISVWVAPRAFEHGDGNKLSAIVNQQNINEKEGFSLGIFRHGTWSFQYGDGESWNEIWDNGNPITRRQWTFLTATYDSQKNEIALYMNGSIISKKKVEGEFGFISSDQPLLIGKHNQAEREGRYNLNMFNGLMDELKIYKRALEPKEVKKFFQSYLKQNHRQIPVLTYDDIKIERNKYKGDQYRPEFHANPPGHWMNEPHAPFYYNGKYHLTYQHNPTGPYWHNISWGHWVSDDLVHWKDLPEAIFPENDTIAPDGIWSGSATYDKDGVPVLVYTFGNWNKVRNQGVALAFPKDKEDPNLTEWVKHPRTSIEQKEGQGITGEFRDPFVWKDEQTGKWNIIVGSGIEGKGGTAWFYESENLLDWDPKGPFYLSNYAKYPFLGDKWELPVFLPLGKYEDGETRYIFIISPKGYMQNVEVYYWLGRYDKENFQFIPDDEEPLYWDYGGNRYIGPSGMIDPKTGRALIFTITAGGNGVGWAGNCSFPTHIFLDDNGELGVKPIVELNSLRKEKLLSAKDKSLSEVNRELDAISGNMLEIIIEMESKNANKYGIKLLKDPEGKEETLLFYDAKHKKLLQDLSNSRIVDINATRRFSRSRRRSTDKRETLRNHFDIEGNALKMHIYIDKALIQAFFNDKKTITTWAYPKLAESKGLQVFAEDGDAIIKSIEIWEMNSIYY